ncbi:LPXTG cell wall anchor domain-containing protein, partial [Apilactobacillus xinyiensis]
SKAISQIVQKQKEADSKAISQIVQKQPDTSSGLNPKDDDNSFNTKSTSENHQNNNNNDFNDNNDNQQFSSHKPIRFNSEHNNSSQSKLLKGSNGSNKNSDKKFSSHKPIRFNSEHNSNSKSNVVSKKNILNNSRKTREPSKKSLNSYISSKVVDRVNVNSSGNRVFLKSFNAYNPSKLSRNSNMRDNLVKNNPNNVAKLPQTNESDSKAVSTIGLILISISASLMSLGVLRKHNK